jgi:hypothetical protein
VALRSKGTVAGWKRRLTKMMEELNRSTLMTTSGYADTPQTVAVVTPTCTAMQAMTTTAE